MGVPEYIGLPGVQRITGAPRNTVDSWKRRGNLPPPDAMHEGEPVWFEKTIVDWWSEKQSD